MSSFREIAGLEESGLKVHIYENHHNWDIAPGTDISAIVHDPASYDALISDVSWFASQPGGIPRISPMFDGYMTSESITEQAWMDLRNTTWDNIQAPNNINGKVVFRDNTDLSGSSFLQNNISY